MYFFFILLLVSVSYPIEAMVGDNAHQTSDNGGKVFGLTTGLYIILGLVGLILLLFCVMKYIR